MAPPNETIGGQVSKKGNTGSEQATSGKSKAANEGNGSAKKKRKTSTKSAGGNDTGGIGGDGGGFVLQANGLHVQDGDREDEREEDEIGGEREEDEIGGERKKESYVEQAMERCKCFDDGVDEIGTPWLPSAIEAEKVHLRAEQRLAADEVRIHGDLVSQAEANKRMFAMMDNAGHEEMRGQVGIEKRRHAQAEVRLLEKELAAVKAEGRQLEECRLGLLAAQRKMAGMAGYEDDEDDEDA